MEPPTRAPWPTDPDTAPDAAARAEMTMRARWLHGMSDGERDALPGLSMREVEALYAAWAAVEVDPGPHPGDDDPA